MTEVRLSLVSHTNVGKTTLARTLLRRDVGEVLDQAHVTEAPERFTLIESDGHALRLWDTPGFGDTARLLRRVKQEGHPLGWFLHQVWDRVADKPLHSSQQALRNVKDEADAVLYLVNAAEDPEGAGYVRGELELLAWVGRPVIALLNQTGPPSPAVRGQLERWKGFLAPFPVVADVLPLDAFCRSWLQEGELFRRVAEVVGAERREAMAALARAWDERNRAVFARSVELVAAHLAQVAADREVLGAGAPSPARRRRAVEALGGRLQRGEAELWEQVVEAHGLEGRARLELERELEPYVSGAQAAPGVGRGALIGGALSGALSGLAADVLAGGLTFGGGLIAGAILGALGGAGLTRGLQLVRARGGPALTWSQPFLDLLLQQEVVRYLAVAHFGRGRGRVAELDQAQAFGAAAAEALRPRAAALAALWRKRESPPELAAALQPELREVLLDALRRTA